MSLPSLPSDASSPSRMVGSSIAAAGVTVIVATAAAGLFSDAAAADVLVRFADGSIVCFDSFGVCG